MKSSGDALGIGEVAQRFGLATHVLRHWESVGLLRPPRTGTGQRRFTPADTSRIAVILRAKEAGLGLDDIGRLLGDGDRATRTAVLHRKRAELAGRIARDQAALGLLDHALTCEHDDLTTCPHFLASVTQPG
ncbi:MerR family transcriptional regulator [Amycolatopsis sp. NPDC088138]|uniref:helix-turn-helix domain-containing protein n=1 Tax=Amycolatopsis sp. NPDC088138 TaxID=3363938 RepID=UPI0038298E5C